MDVELVTVGTELLLGFTVDTNSAEIGRALAAAGVVLYFYHPWDKAPQLALKSEGRGAQVVLGGVF